MRACVFVDGENFRFSISELFDMEFKSEDYLPRNAKWSAFFDHLRVESGATSLLRTYWYVVEDIDYWPYGFQKCPDEKLFMILSKNRDCAAALNSETNPIKKSQIAHEWVKKLEQNQSSMDRRFTGWRNVQDSIANNTDCLEFRRAGSINYNLFDKKLRKEKAVDVRLSVDLLELRAIYDVAIIVSGDQDYVPAVQKLKDSGKIVVNVAFAKSDQSLLPGGARRLNILTDKRVVITYEKCKAFLGIGGQFPPK